MLLEPLERARELRARARVKLPGSEPRTTRIADSYRIHFDEPWRERMFLSSAGFLGAFGATRAVTHAVKSDKIPIGNISESGRHIHHCVFGISGLLATGLAWNAMLGTGGLGQSRAASRATSLAYGAASALTLDEFALWLDMDADEYWNREGRKSIDAVVLFGAVLSLGSWGAPFFRDTAKRISRRRQKRSTVLGLLGVS
ncbi:MAG: hypothetical protein JOZ25_05395 [Actinobacteria bacterium]|nr:hypothetical protein [Actinomycetota bacterium]